MRSLGPAGWAAHGFYGFAAKTFGNPGGATSGTGYFVPGMRPGPPPNPGIKFTVRTSPTGGQPVLAMQSDAAGNTLLVDKTGRTFHSTNGGVTWALVSTIAGFDSVQATGRILTAAGTWLLSAQQNIGGVTFYRSTNIGVTWTPIVSGIGAAGSCAIATDGAGRWFGIGNVVPASPANYGHSLTDDGQTWSLTGNVTTLAGTVAQDPQLWDGAQWIVFSNDPVNTTDAAIWTSPDTLTWTEHLASGPSGNNPVYAGALLSGGVLYVANQFGSDMYTGATVAALAASDPVSFNPLDNGAFLIRAGVGGQFYVFDSEGNVANCLDFINWLQGTLNFQTGVSEFATAVCYDAAHNSVIAGGSAGSICTVP